MTVTFSAAITLMMSYVDICLASMLVEYAAVECMRITGTVWTQDDLPVLTAVESNIGFAIVNTAHYEMMSTTFRSAMRITVTKYCQKRAKNTTAGMQDLLKITCSLVTTIHNGGKSVSPVM